MVSRERSKSKMSSDRVDGLTAFKRLKPKNECEGEPQNKKKQTEKKKEEMKQLR